MALQSSRDGEAAVANFTHFQNSKTTYNICQEKSHEIRNNFIPWFLTGNSTVWQEFVKNRKSLHFLLFDSSCEVDERRRNQNGYKAREDTKIFGTSSSPEVAEIDGGERMLLSSHRCARRFRRFFLLSIFFLFVSVLKN